MMSQLRVTANTEMAGLAPSRVGEPKNREDVLLPLSMRERCCVAAIALNLNLLGGLSQEYREEGAFVQASVILLRTFKDVTGVSWEVAEKFW